MNILVVGAGSAREFGYRRLRELGHWVGVVDDLSFIPTDLVDWYHPFAPTDGAAVVDAVGRSGRRMNAVLCFGEWHLGAAVAAAQLLGIPGPRLDVEKARQKDAMRAAFAGAGMRSPLSVPVRDVIEVAGLELPDLPLVVKPVDYSSSSGVTLVTRTDDLAAAVAYALSKSFRGLALIEEYVAGEEFSVEGVVADSVPRVLGTTRKWTTPPPYFVEVGHSYPAELDPPAREILESEAIRAARAVGLEACAFHCEIKLEGTEAVCIEIAGRSGGDHIPQLMYEAQGVDLYGAEVAAITGADISEQCRPRRSGAAAVRYLEAEAGTRVTWPAVRSIAGSALADCLVDLKHYYPWYTIVPPLDGSGRRLGYCILAGDPDEVRLAYDQAVLLAPARPQ